MYIVFTADDCKWCERAKLLLTHQRLPFVTFPLSDPSIRSLWSMMNFQTVPQVFNGSTYIGGYEDLKGYLDYHYNS